MSSKLLHSVTSVNRFWRNQPWKIESSKGDFETYYFPIRQSWNALAKSRLKLSVTYPTRYPPIKSEHASHPITILIGFFLYRVANAVSFNPLAWNRRIVNYYTNDFRCGLTFFSRSGLYIYKQELCVLWSALALGEILQFACVLWKSFFYCFSDLTFRYFKYFA